MTKIEIEKSKNRKIKNWKLEEIEIKNIEKGRIKEVETEIENSKNKKNGSSRN